MQIPHLVYNVGSRNTSVKHGQCRDFSFLSNEHRLMGDEQDAEGSPLPKYIELILVHLFFPIWGLSYPVKKLSPASPPDCNFSRVFEGCFAGLGKREVRIGNHKSGCDRFCGAIAWGF